MNIKKKIKIWIKGGMTWGEEFESSRIGGISPLFHENALVGKAAELTTLAFGRAAFPSVPPLLIIFY